MSRNSDSNWGVLTDHDYKSSGVDHCPIPANQYIGREDGARTRIHQITWLMSVYKTATIPLYIKWALTGLNRRPQHYECFALTNWAKGPFYNDMEILFEYIRILTELLHMQVVFHHPLPVSMCLNKEIFSSGLIPTGAAEWTAAFDVA